MVPVGARPPYSVPMSRAWHSSSTAAYCRSRADFLAVAGGQLDGEGVGLDQGQAVVPSDLLLGALQRHRAVSTAVTTSICSPLRREPSKAAVPAWIAVPRAALPEDGMRRPTMFLPIKALGAVEGRAEARTVPKFQA